MKSVLIVLLLGITAAELAQVDNVRAIGEFLRAENYTSVEDVELEMASKGLGMVLAEAQTSSGCNQGSGRAKQRCESLARQVFGSSWVSTATVTLYENLVDQCSFGQTQAINLALFAMKVIGSELSYWTKAVGHCKYCKSNASCHSWVKANGSFFSCGSRLGYDVAKTIQGMNGTPGGSLSSIAYHLMNLFYTVVYRWIPMCSWGDFSGFAKKFGFASITGWDFIRFISSALIGFITSEVKSAIVNVIAALAVPGIGTAFSAARYGWKLYTFSRDCKWDVQSAVKSVIKLGISLYEAATGGTNTECANKFVSAAGDCVDVMLCYLKAGGKVYSKLGCSSYMRYKYGLR